MAKPFTPPPLESLVEAGKTGGFTPPPLESIVSDDESKTQRYLRQSGISAVWNMLTNHPNIPASGPERRAAQNQIIQQHIKPLGDFIDLVKQGKFKEAGNKVGETIGETIPGVSQAGDIIKDIADGRYVDIPVDMAGGITQALGLKYGAKALGETRAPFRAARAEQEFLKNTQPAIASYGNAVGNKLKYLEDLRKAIPLMQEQDPKIKVDLMSNEHTGPQGIGPKPPVNDTFVPANQKAIAAVDEQFNPMRVRARAYEQTFGRLGNGGVVTDNVINSINPKYRAMNPTGYKNLVDAYTDAYGTLQNPKPLTIDELISRRETTNAQLAKFYDGLAGQIGDTLAFDANKESLNAEAQALRREVYTKIDPEHNGEWAAELMDRRGALQNVRDAHEKLINKTVGSAQPGTGAKVAGTVGDVTGMLTGLKSAKNVALDRAARPATAAANIEKAFRQEMEPLPKAPPVPAGIYPQNPRQLGPGTPQVNAPGYNTPTGNPVRVTTGPPLQVVEPAAPLTPTEPPADFMRQRGFEENPTGEGLGHSLKSNPKYTWYDEAEQRPQLELERTPKVPDVFQRLLHEGEQPEGPALGQPAGPPPPMQSSTPAQKPMNFNDIIDILHRGDIF